MECNIGNDLQLLSSKRKLSQHDEKLDCHLTEVDQESISSSVENYSPIDVEPNTNEAKKRRLIIGKNVEKIPELTFSTIERSLDAFINDAANNFCQLKENNKEHVSNINQNTKLDPKNNIKLVNSQNLGQQSHLRQNQSILVDLVTGKTSGMTNNQFFSQSQQTPLVIMPSNIESPAVPRMHPVQKEPAKNIQPIVIEPFQKVHLTNAVNLASQVIDSNPRVKTNQIKNTSIKPKATDSKIEDTSVEIFPKKKKVYNRVTPTIRAIYEKEQQNKEESQPKAGEAETKQDDGEFKDVHDEIGDIFELSCRKANLNRSNSSDINLDDICVSTNTKSNQDAMRSRKICKIRKSFDKKDCNEENDLDDKTTINNQTLTSTRTLRSRTNSQRKNF